MILSSLLLTFNLLIQQTIQVSEFLQRKDQKEWLIFLAQLEEELKSSHNVSVK
ncbi:competence protein ComGF, partial [Enterococcus faecium]|nr:competence protein ComGF [Enterococcus faecium]